eukprot:3967659-Lingulodinium_polyedra.AAC.1
MCAGWHTAFVYADERVAGRAGDAPRSARALPRRRVLRPNSRRRETRSRAPFRRRCSWTQPGRAAHRFANARIPEP